MTRPERTGVVGRQRPLRRWTLIGLWLLAWLVYAAYFQAQWVFGERPIYFVTGDEPHYLVIATSLLRDRDLDVLDNYQRQDYFSFYPYHVGDPRDMEDMHALYGRGGHVNSKHGLGLSLLLLPAFALAGAGGAKLLMMALAALLAVQTYLLAREATGATGPALAAWIAVAFSPPLLLYADQLYPEVPGALLTVVALRAAIAPRLTRGSAVAAGLSLGALPWLHLRYVPLVAVAALALAARAYAGDESRRAALRRLGTSPLWLAALPAAAGVTTLLLLDSWLYGGVPSVGEYGDVSPGNLLRGLPGLLLDQQFGLLVYAPIMVLGVVGLPLLPRLGWRRGGTILACLTVYFLFIGSFSYWYGAFSPPARMLVPVAPLLVVPLTLTLERWRGVPMRALFVGLLVLTWSIAHLLVDVPRLRYNLPAEPSQMLAYLSAAWSLDVVGWLPSFVRPTGESYLLAGGWVAAALAVVALAAHRWHLPVRRVRREPPLPSPDAKMQAVPAQPAMRG